jgi:flagellar biosynthetic protein FlhB
MSWLDDQAKTEKPTPKRRTKVRSEGSVAKSADLNSAVVLTIASLMLIWFGARLFEGLMQIMRGLFREMGSTEIRIDALPTYLAHGSWQISLLLAPLFLGVMAAGLAVNIGQVGFKVTGKAAYPKLSRVSPIQGFKRLFSVRSFVELAKSLLKLAIIGGVVYLSIADKLDDVYSLSDMPVEVLAPIVGILLGRVFLIVSLSLLVIGALDFAYAKYEYEKSLKMTKEEVKEESRQSEGDPKVKSKIREIQFKSAFRRMMKRVPEADVVITNPTHLAVALRYDRAKSAAPVVVAKGARKVAERIKKIAQEHGIPIIENKPLAQVLFKTVDIGMEIPMDLYKAVAEVLAYVYRLKKKYFGVA